MKKRHRSTIAATLLTTALLGFGALPALADLSSTLAADVLDQAGGDQFQLTVTLPYPSGEAGGGFFVGLTTGTLTDTQGLTASIAFQMFCVDFNDEITYPPNPTYNVVVESIAGPTLAPVLAPIGETLPALQLQALLGADFGLTPSGNAAYDTEVQDDIWNQDTPPPAGAGTPFPADTQNQLTNAQAAYLAGANFSSAYILDITPYPGGPGQAFMPVDPGGFNNSSTPPVPEPGTLVMLGLGLIGLGSLKLRKSQR